MRQSLFLIAMQQKLSKTHSSMCSRPQHYERKIPNGHFVYKIGGIVYCIL